MYEAAAALRARQFAAAAELLLDSTATFTSAELFPYSECVRYAVTASLVALDR